MTKKVNVQISVDDMKSLKKGKYNLCFAKKVGDSFNVIWHSMNPTQYLQSNTISWDEEYQIFACQGFQAGVIVNEETNVVPIELGQQVTLDEEGYLNPAVNGGTPNALTFINTFAPIHPAVNQVVSGPSGTDVATIYVAENNVQPGQAVLTPKEEIQVWFQQNVKTGTMFSQARSDAKFANLTNVDEVILEYSNGKWV